MPNVNKRDIVCIGDTHFPYQHKPTIKKILAFVKKTKPRYVVQIGDLYDFFHFSKYPKSMAKFEPEWEVKEGRKQAEEFWKAVKKASPKSICFQLKGNHCDRPMKRLQEKAPELEPFMGPELKRLFEFKGVTTVHTSSEELELEGILFHHGHYAKLGDHMKHNQQSTVVGHSHVGGAVYQHYKTGTRYELNCGYVGDPKQGPLQYKPQRKVNYWTHGLGYIDQHGPRFIPL